MRRFLRSVALLAALALPARAQLATDTAARLDELFASMRGTDRPGCVLGVDRDGRPLYRKAYGMANLETLAPLTVSSVLESGSVAKQFTAAAIVQLAMEGKLRLDEPVRTYVPELPDYGTPVTVRQLLHHTSGVRDMWVLFTLAGKMPGTVLFGMGDILPMVARQKALNFAPGSEYLYSNSGYFLLAEIVKRVSGMPFAQFSRTRFLAPAGMESTTWRDDWNAVVPNRAPAYAPDARNGWRSDPPFMSVHGAGGLLFTVDDALRWNRALDDHRVGSATVVDTMEVPAVLTSGKPITYALGLVVRPGANGEREVAHTGATGGYRTYLGRYPARRLSIAILCNRADASTDVLGSRVAGVFIGGTPAAAATPAAPTPPRTPVAITDKELAQLAGAYYSAELDVRYVLASARGALTLAIADRPPFPLAKVAADEFVGPLELTLKMTRGKSGAVDGFTVAAGRVTNLRFERVAR